MSEHDDRIVRRVVGAASGRDAAEPCPDAEVLGLYAERQLDGAERAGVETHVAGCARCQATLAVFVRSAPDGVEAAGAGVRAGAGDVGAAWWSGWKWLVPVAATAAVVTIAVWVRPPSGPGEAVVQEPAAPEAVAMRQPVQSQPAAPADAPGGAPGPAPSAAMDRRAQVPATELVGSAVASASPSAEARQEAVAVPAPDARAKALASSAGARLADAGADARERAAPAAPVPPPAAPAVAPAEPREAEAFARRLEETISVSRADSATPAPAKAAAAQESAVGASRGLGAAATAGAARRPAQLTGRVTYRTRAALPAGAVVDVRLLDVSRMDAPATLLGRVEIVTRGEQVPVPFTIGYDAAAIDARFRYTLQVTITIEGRVAYRTTTAHPVLTSGAPAANVEVVVEPMR